MSAQEPDRPYVLLYGDFRAYLREYIQWKQRMEPGLSYRKLAKAAGYANPPKELSKRNGLTCALRWEFRSITPDFKEKEMSMGSIGNQSRIKIDTNPAQKPIAYDPHSKDKDTKALEPRGNKWGPMGPNFGKDPYHIVPLYQGGNNPGLLSPMWNDPQLRRPSPAAVDTGGHPIETTNVDLPGARPRPSWGIDQSSVNWNKIQITPSEQMNYDQWKNKVHNDGVDPVEAAKSLGDSNVKQLGGTSNGVEQWQFRLGKNTRVSFTIDNENHKVKVVGIGHT